MKKQNLKKILIPLSLTSAFIPLIGLSATFNDNPTLPNQDHITPTDKANKTYDWEKQYTNLLNWENKVELNATLKAEVNKFYTSKLYNDLYKTVLSNDFTTSFIETDYKDIVEHIINKHKELLTDRNVKLYYVDYEDWKDNDTAFIQLKTNIIRTIEAMVLSKYTTSKPSANKGYDLEDYLNNTNYTTLLNNLKTFYSQEKEFIKSYYDTFLQYYKNIVEGADKRNTSSDIPSLISFNIPAVLFETDDINNQIAKTKEILTKQKEEFARLNAEYQTKTETIDKQNWVRNQLQNVPSNLSSFSLSNTSSLKMYNKDDDTVFKPFNKSARNILQIGMGNSNIIPEYGDNRMSIQFIDYLEKIVNNAPLNVANGYRWDAMNNIIDILILSRYIKTPKLSYDGADLDNFIRNFINSINLSPGFVEVFTRNNNSYLYTGNKTPKQPTIPKSRDVEFVMDYIDNLKTFLNQVGLEALDNNTGLNASSGFRNQLYESNSFYYYYTSVFNKGKRSDVSPANYETYEYKTQASEKDLYSSVIDWYKEAHTYYKEHFLDTNTANVNNFKKYLKLLDVINNTSNSSTSINPPIASAGWLYLNTVDNLYFYKIHLDSLKDILNTNGGYEKYYSDDAIEVEGRTNPVLLSDYLSEKKSVYLNIFSKGTSYYHYDEISKTSSSAWPSDFPNYSKFNGKDYQGSLFDTTLLSKYNGFINKGMYDKLEETEKEKYRENTLAKDEFYWYALEQVWNAIKNYLEKTKSIEEYNLKSQWFRSVDGLYYNKEASKKWIELILSLRNEFAYENLSDDLNRQLQSNPVEELKKVKILETDINISQYYERLLERKNNLNLEYQNLNNNVPKLISAINEAETVKNSEKYTNADQNKQQLFDLFFNTYKAQITDNKLTANITNSQLLQEIDTLDFIIKMLGANSNIETTANIQLNDLKTALNSLTDNLKTKIENDIIIPMTDDNWNYDDLSNKRDILLSDLTNIKDAIENDDYSALIAKINVLNTKSNEIKELENTLNIENNAKDLYIATKNNDLKVALKNANDSHKHNLDLITVYVEELKKEKVEKVDNSNKGWEALKAYRDLLLERYKVIMENGNSLFNTVNNDTSSTIRNVILNKVGNILNSLIFTDPINKNDAFMSLHIQYLDTIANTLAKAENILSSLKTYKDINQNNDKLDLAIDNLDNSNKLNDPDAKIYEIDSALREVLLGLTPNSATPPVDNSQSLNYLQQTLNYYKSVKVALDTFKDKTLEYYADDKLTELLTAYHNALTTQLSNLDTNKDNLEYLSQNISSMIADFHTLQHLLNSLTHFKAIITDKETLKDTFKDNLKESAKKLDNSLENTPLIINSAIVETLKTNVNKETLPLKHKEDWSKILNDRFSILEQKHSQILDIIKVLKDNNVKVDILEVVANDVMTNLEKSKKLVFNDDKTLKDDINYLNANEMLNLLDSEIAPLNGIVDVLNEALEHFKTSDLTLKEFNKELANSNEKLFNKKYQKALLKALNKDLKANNADTKQSKKLKGKYVIEIAVLISLVFMLLASISLLLMLKNRK